MKTTYQPLTAIGLFIGSMIFSAISYQYIANVISGTDNHHYECACSVPPVLTLTQAIPIGVVLYGLEMCGIYYILRACKFTKRYLIIMMILLLIINALIYCIGGYLLTVQVSG